MPVVMRWTGVFMLVLVMLAPVAVRADHNNT